MQKYVKKYWVLGAILLVGFVIHLIPLIRFGTHGLGYDAGFYRRHLIKPLVSFPNTLTPGLGDDALLPRMVLDVLRTLRIPPDIILFGSHILLWALGTIALYLLVKEYFGERIGLVAALLFSVSPIQYVAYWFVLWKHAFALPLFFLLLFALGRRSYWAVLLALALALSHNTTTAFAIFVLGIFLIMQPRAWRVTVPALLLMTGIYLWLHPAATGFVSARPVGVFVPIEYFLWNIAPLLPFALLGAAQIARNHSPLFVFTLAALAFPMAQLPFWERVLIFTDITLVIAAACGITLITSWLLRNRESKLAISAILVCALFGGTYLALLNNRIRDWDPFIVPYEARAEINKIPKLIGSNEKILTTTELAPWIFGWTQNNIIAPGLLGDPHNHEEWILYWGDPNHTEAKNFLDVYGDRFYFFIPPDEQNAFVPKNKCVRKLSEYLVEYYCPTT
ncbi:MAG: DUF2079 domain-containing protein [Candidatus Ryanbacteria bacterium]|nr:DUF2079 domain-containing protein [Candidatus Ryanbacteria bacterium]